ncbi:MAG: hypothetical protein ACREUQ_05745, partial [Burkholderiales bacterium]
MTGPLRGRMVLTSHQLPVTAFMPFNQPPPQLKNQYSDDRVLRAYLARALPAQVLAQVEPELIEMGEMAGGSLYRFQLADRLSEPRHTPWDAWGNRVD